MNRWWKAMSIACAAVLFSAHSLPAQEAWEELVEQLADEDEEGTLGWENSFEELSDLREHPLNINTATEEQLERFPFLTGEQIDAILGYVHAHGPIATANELPAADGMDKRTIRQLLPFICFGPGKKDNSLFLREVLKYGRHEWMVRADIPFYVKEGYKIHSDETLEKYPNRQYLGKSYYHSLRYNFRFSDRVYAGVTAEKDAGEPFFAGKNKKGYDFYSPYLFIRDVGRFNSLAAGNYRASYGYGLVINMDFNMGKAALLSTLGRRARGLYKHSSTNEYNYLQGAGASYRLSDLWTADVFCSYRRMDGTTDSLFIRSLKKDGYHRLPRELDKKNTLTNQVVGSHLDYNGKYVEFGLTGVYNVFDKPLNPERRYYNAYYPRGRDFWNAGVHYRMFWKRFTLFGETAVDKHGAVATMNGLRYLQSQHTRWMVMNRFYDVRYQSVYAQPVGEGSTAQNESGLYVGLETRLLKWFKLACYGDFFYFPGKKYLLSETGTKGFDGSAQISYSPTYHLSMFIRYRYKEKKRDRTDADGTRLTLPYVWQKCRYQLDYAQETRGFSLKTVLDYTRAGHRGRPVSRGFLASQSGGCRLGALRVDVSATWFRTDGYDSRITLYEKNVLYAYSFPSFYGKGTRLAVNARCEPDGRLTLQAKYGMTHYFDRDAAGSGLEEVGGDTKNDLCLLVRLKI